MSETNGLSIVLDPEPPNYLPGQTVAGRVIVSSPGGVEARGLSISLRGEVYVRFTIHRHHNTYVYQDQVDLNNYEYKDQVDLLDLSKTLLSGVNNLPPGVNSFPFSFQLPQNLPASVTCSKGCVEYALNGSLVHPIGQWTANLVILVFPIHDIRPFPELKNPVEAYSEVQPGCCCASAPMRLWCSLDKTGFFPGDLIKFRLSLENAQDVQFDSFTVELVQNFIVQGKSWSSTQACEDATAVASIVQSSWEVNNPNRGEFSWEGELLVPVCAPSGLRLLQISMNYTFNAVANVKGSCTIDNPTVSFDVMIGSLTS